MIRDKWDEKKTLSQNFENLGLKLKLKPNLRHSKEGQEMLKRVNKVLDGDKTAKPSKEFPEKQKDYNELFPGVFKYASEIEPYESVPKLRGDDLHIMQRLEKKYGDDIDKMFTDIKLNYMQWSKSVLKKKHRALKAYEY